MDIEFWDVDRPKDYPRNPRKWNAQALEKVGQSILAYGFRQPIVVDVNEVIAIGHLRRAAARHKGIKTVPVHIARDLTPEQIRGLRLADNRTNQEAEWDLSLLAPEIADLRALAFDLSQTGFDGRELDALLRDPAADEKADQAPPLPEVAATQPGDLWRLGPHRVLCSDATSPEAVSRLLGEHKPFLMVTDPPYGIELDSEWRDRAGLNSAPGQKRTAASIAAAKDHPMYPAEASYMKHRTEGHTETTISGDTRADWSEAFELAPSLQIAYVWHASRFTREVLDGLLRIGFLHHQQIIWDKTRTVLTRTLYWFQHEPCWFVRKKNAPWYGKPGENSTIWACPSPKFIMGGSDEEKYDHPTQKPVELMRRPILNHTRRGELVYEPFLGSGSALAAAEITERVCYGMEIDPKYCDVICQRWSNITSKQPTLEGDGRTFDEIRSERLTLRG
jgi:DNA modification methylase